MALLQNIDPDGLFEYSVVFTDRSLNHMSQNFQLVMRNLSTNLRQVYGSEGVALIPGGGTFGMEAIARQFANDQNVLVIRNGWFSFRWSQIFSKGKITSDVTVLSASPTFENFQAPFKPIVLEDIISKINENKPAVVFAPHVETSAGIMLPDEYLKGISSAVHSNGGIFVLDCVASGSAWVDMKSTGVDVLLTAPQKGWSASPSAGLVMLSQRAVERMEHTASDSFAIDLKKWHGIMQIYENGGHAYHATMPTDALRAFRDTMLETREFGFDKLEAAQWELGNQVRAMLKAKGIVSVAADGFGAPGVVVSYTSDPKIQNGSKFSALGLQTGAAYST